MKFVVSIRAQGWNCDAGIDYIDIIKRDSSEEAREAATEYYRRCGYKGLNYTVHKAIPLEEWIQNHTVKY